MTETCKRWGLPSHRRFTGGCSMKLASESNGEPECEICVKPVDIAGFSPGTVIDESCKRWFVQESIFNPKCTNKFEPEEGNAECPICVYPTFVDSSCSVCVEAPDEFTWVVENLTRFDRWGFTGLPATWLISQEEFNEVNVRRFDKCTWSSPPILWAIEPSNDPGIMEYRHYVIKMLTVSGSSGPLVINSSMYTYSVPEGNFGVIRWGRSTFATVLQNFPENKVCYPRISGVQIVSQMGAPHIFGAPLSCEPVP